MASLGDLVVNIKANSSNFKRGTKQATSSMKRFSRSLKRIGIATAFAAGTAAVLTFRKQMKELDEVAKLSARTGFGAREIQGFALAAELGGSSAASAAKGMEQFTRRMGEAALGSGTAATQLKKMGIDAKKLGELQPSEQLRQVADAIAALPTKAQQANAAYQLFGRGGLELVNVLAQGSAEMENLNAEAEAMGLALSRDQLKAVEDVNDAWTKMTFALSGAAAGITADLAPALIDMLELMVDMSREAKVTGKWLSQLFNVGGKHTGKTREQLLAQRDAIVASGKFPGGANSQDFGKPVTEPTGFPMGEGDLGIDIANKTAKRGLFDRIAGSKQMIKLQQDLLKIKLAIEEADEKAKRATEAQIGLDNMRKGEEIAAARKRVEESKKGSGGTGFAGIAQRGSVQALQAITRSAGPGKQQLDEQKKANAILQQLLDEQRADKVAALLLQGAV